MTLKGIFQMIRGTSQVETTAPRSVRRQQAHPTIAKIWESPDYVLASIKCFYLHMEVSHIHRNSDGQFYLTDVETGDIFPVNGQDKCTVVLFREILAA